jgi:hypothetical protein
MRRVRREQGCKLFAWCVGKNAAVKKATIRRTGDVIRRQKDNQSESACRELRLDVITIFKMDASGLRA